MRQWWREEIPSEAVVGGKRSLVRQWWGEEIPSEAVMEGRDP